MRWRIGIAAVACATAAYWLVFQQRSESAAQSAASDSGAALHRDTGPNLQSPVVMEATAGVGTAATDVAATGASSDAVTVMDRRGYDAAVARLQMHSSAGADSSTVTAAVERVWAQALDAQLAAEAINLLVSWSTSDAAEVAETAQAAVRSLEAALQPQAVTPPPADQGHERLRDLALNGQTPADRREATQQLALLDNPLRDAWLAMVAQRDADPENRTLAQSLLTPEHESSMHKE